MNVLTKKQSARAEGLKEGIGCVPMEVSIRRIAAAIRSVNEEKKTIDGIVRRVKTDPEVRGSS